MYKIEAVRSLTTILQMEARGLTVDASLLLRIYSAVVCTCQVLVVQPVSRPIRQALPDPRLVSVCVVQKILMSFSQHSVERYNSYNNMPHKHSKTAAVLHGN